MRVTEAELNGSDFQKRTKYYTDISAVAEKSYFDIVVLPKLSTSQLMTET